MSVATLPRVGFLGTGWIGRHRMQAVVDAGHVEPVAVSDADPEAAAAAASGLAVAADLDELLAMELDGLVIATPSALHADQAIAALDRGVAVFCQKPLARTAQEAAAVVAAARRADRLLGVDFSYRHTAAVQAIAPLVREGELGEVHTIDLVFHNANGPDKPWFTRRDLAGGGCLMDLGSHLVDLALWLTGSSAVEVRAARLLRDGRPLEPAAREVEDFATTTLELDSAVEARVACSWFLPAGRECVIECTLYGTGGAASVRNVGGSFYDLQAERWTGTTTDVLAEPPDEWGGRAICAWAQQLARSSAFDPAAQELVRVSEVLDDVYRAAR